MQISGLAGVFAALVGLAAPGAAQAGVTCEGAAKGARNEEVRVFIRLSDGRETQRSAMWTPPPAGARPFPSLNISYAIADEGLGEVKSASVGALVHLEGRVIQSRSAQVSVSMGGSEWTRPWRMFESNMAQLRAGSPPTGGNTPAAFWGVVPVTYIDETPTESTNPDLAAALARGGQVKVSIDGDRSENFGRNVFDLTVTTTRDRLFAEALAKAETAARKPAKCTKDEQ